MVVIDCNKEKTITIFRPLLRLTRLEELVTCVQCRLEVNPLHCAVDVDVRDDKNGEELLAYFNNHLTCVHQI